MLCIICKGEPRSPADNSTYIMIITKHVNIVKSSFICSSEPSSAIVSCANTMRTQKEPIQMYRL